MPLRFNGDGLLSFLPEADLEERLFALTPSQHLYLVPGMRYVHTSTPHVVKDLVVAGKNSGRFLLLLCT